MTPFDDLFYLVNHVLLGEEPTIEDFILLVGTMVAFIAFILWCCFPIQPKDPGPHRQFTCKVVQNPSKACDDKDKDANSADDKTTSTSASSGSSGLANSNKNNTFSSGMALPPNSMQYNNGASGSYSKNGTVAMHNYYVKNGHHCCT
ncbi:uncharacterized protein [Drosophila tropicalis]|uniref:uncharacterized protein n=1 Tax=Drosophila tropicalis TaxID=46794 RepID=UPI0035AB900E